MCPAIGRVAGPVTARESNAFELLGRIESTASGSRFMEPRPVVVPKRDEARGRARIPLTTGSIGDRRHLLVPPIDESIARQIPPVALGPMVSTIRHSVTPGVVDVEFALVRAKMFDARRVRAPVERNLDSMVP